MAGIKQGGAAKNMSSKIGFIGLGIMGSRMAANLVKKGFEVCVYNRTREKTEPFKQQGCGVSYTPKQLAGWCDTLIVMVSDPAAVEAVMEGENGGFAGLSRGKTLINMSTVSPEFTRQLAEKCAAAGINFLDCPVSGSKPLAEAGTLVILAGGTEQDVKNNKNILLAMGGKIIYAGTAPAGSYLKLCVNLVMGHMTSAIAEGTLFAEACGVNPALVFDTIEANPALQCKYFNMKRKSLIEKKFPPAFPLKHMLKDARFIMSAAEQKEIDIPVTAAVLELLEKSAGKGHGEEDISAMYEGLKINKK